MSENSGNRKVKKSKELVLKKLNLTCNNKEGSLNRLRILDETSFTTSRGGEISLTPRFNTVFFFYNSFSISAKLGILIPGLADFVTNSIV
jgi:hypothetical protein